LVNLDPPGWVRRLQEDRDVERLRLGCEDVQHRLYHITLQVTDNQFGLELIHLKQVGVQISLHLVQQEASRVENDLAVELTDFVLNLLLQGLCHQFDAPDGCKHLVVDAGAQELDHLVRCLQLRVLLQLGHVTQGHYAARLVKVQQGLLLQLEERIFTGGKLNKEKSSFKGLVVDQVTKRECAVEVIITNLGGLRFIARALNE
jgi:hypothetical protein